MKQQHDDGASHSHDDFFISKGICRQGLLELSNQLAKVLIFPGHHSGTVGII
jgi:hypothetical protein